MTKHYWLVIIVLLLGPVALAQRISTGITLGVPAFHRTAFPDRYINPRNSYLIYYTANEKKDGDPVWDQYVNGIMAGLNFSVDYKRFMLTLEVLGESTTFKIPMKYPQPLSATLDEEWLTWKATRSSLVLPLLLSIKLTSKANGPFVLGGVSRYFHSFKESPDNDGTALFTFKSDRELLGILYNEHDFNNYIVGLGYKSKDVYVSLRFQKRMGGELNEYPLAKFTQINFVVARTLSFQKLKKGHIIYVE